MYTSRERDAAEFPGGIPHQVRFTGTGEVPALTLSATPPPQLQDVKAQGRPLGELQEVEQASPLDVTWAVGSDRDALWLQVQSADGTSSTVCRFDDAAGVGTVPARSLAFHGEALLSLHRGRLVEQSHSSELTSAIAFDYSVSRRILLRP
jgi:hypothetical protein